MANNATMTNATYNSTGKFGSSMSGGQADAASLSAQTAFTAECWGKFTGNSFSNPRVAQGQPGIYWFGIDKDGTAACYNEAGGSILRSTKFIGDGAWHHMAMVLTGSSMSLYVDGTQVATVAQGLSASPNWTGSHLSLMHYTGDTSNGYDWPTGGETDEHAIFSGARYSATFTAPTSPYVGNETSLLRLYHVNGNGTDDTGTTPATATSYTLSGPSTATVGSASSSFSVTMNGTLSSAATITPSDGGAGGTFTPSTVTIAAGVTGGTFTYTPASTGSKTISTTNNKALTDPAAVTLTANSGPVTIARSNPAIFYAPNMFCDDGTSRMSANPGAYAKFNFTGTSLTLLTTALTSMGAYPQLRFIIDGIAYNVGMSTATSYSVATGLASGTHTCEMYLRSSLYSAGDWWSLVNALKITGFQLDAGCTVSAPTTRPKVYMAFGDSETQGYNLEGTNSPVTDDALGNYVCMIAEALNAEYGQVGWGGLSYGQGGVSSVPAFNTSYASVASGYSRLSSGLFITQPDYVSVMLGTNTNPTQAEVTTAITNLRAAAPSAWLFFIVPGCGQGRANITAAVNAAISGGDAKVVLIDAGTRYQTGLYASGASGQQPTEAAPADGGHYSRRTNGRLAAEWTRQMQHYLEPRRFTVITS